MNRSLSLLFLLTLIAGCGPMGEGYEATETQGSAIVGGERSVDSDNAVVELIQLEEATKCSGALVAPNLILTAAHCVVKSDINGMFSCDTRGVLVTSSPPDGELGAPVDAASIEVYVGATHDGTPDAHGVKIFASGSQVICRNDIAFLVIDTDLDVPLLPLRLQRPITRGETIRAVGYGETGESGSKGRYQRTGVIVTAVGTDGTHPASGQTGPNTFVTGPGACHGDSGGPAISEETGAVTGVYSLSAGVTCEIEQVRNVYTQLPPFTALAEKAFAFAGHEPLPEVVPGTGAAGAAGAGAEPSDGAEGGQGASGGTSSSGGKGASDGTGDTGSGAESSSGGSRPVDGGSGARRDSSCSVVGALPSRLPTPAALGAALLVCSGLVRRRFRPRSLPNGVERA